MGKGAWEGEGWEQVLPSCLWRGLLHQGWGMLLLVWETEEPVLNPGALGWLVQAVAAVNPALSAGRVCLPSMVRAGLAAEPS